MESAKERKREPPLFSFSLVSLFKDNYLTFPFPILDLLILVFTVSTGTPSHLASPRPLF